MTSSPGLALFGPEPFLLAGLAQQRGLDITPAAALYGRAPCSICGHPTGDCTEEHVMGESTSKTSPGGARGKKTDEGELAGAAGGNPAAETQQSGDTKDAQGGAKLERTNAAERQAVVTTDPTEGTDAALVDVDDPDALEALVSRADTAELVALDCDVVERFYYPGTKRPSFRILFAKGQVVPRSVIEARAADIRLAQDAASDDVPTRVAATVDATTLASGTYPGVAAAGAAGEPAGSGTTQ